VSVQKVVSLIYKIIICVHYRIPLKNFEYASFQQKATSLAGSFYRRRKRARP